MAKKRQPAKPKKPDDKPAPPAPDEAVVEPDKPQPSKPKKPKKGEAVYEVEIPGCLVGHQYILASSPEEAVEIYKRPACITRHQQPAQVHLTDLDPANLPEGVSLYGEE